MSEAMSLWTEEAPAYVRPPLAEYVSGERNGLVCVGSFSGCGGSSLGLKAAGWDVRAAIEFIPAAAETYRANFPTTKMLEKDIREVKPGRLLATLGLKRGQLDLFEGSPPCASFSSAGMGDAYREHECRACGGEGVLPAELGGEEVPCEECDGSGQIDGTEKKYSDSEQRTDDLFWEWARLLKGLLPRAFVAENVPGLLNGMALEEYCWRITKALGALGYRVTANVLNAANYGVPQERRRLIFVGLREDQTGRFEWPARQPVPHTTRQALASVDPEDPDHRDWLESSSMQGMAVGRTWEWKKGLREKDDCARCGRPLGEHEKRERQVRSVKKEKASGASRTTHDVICADGEKGIEVKDYFLLTLPDLDRPCSTLTATGSQVGAASVVHPTECRKFTPAEAKALCGFPADFVLTGTREQRYERMGRAVPPPMYEALGRRLAEALS